MSKTTYLLFLILITSFVTPCVIKIAVQLHAHILTLSIDEEINNNHSETDFSDVTCVKFVSNSINFTLFRSQTNFKKIIWNSNMISQFFGDKIEYPPKKSFFTF